jgi:hypothetical protein
MRRIRVAAVLAILAPLTLQADVLVLRNGSRVQGELIAVRGGVIEFEEQRGFGGRRTIRVDREEVARIELDRSVGGGGGDGGYPGSGGGRPPGMRERSISVASTLGWNDTGIDLRSGQTVYFEASGNVRWGRDRRDGPEGENDSPNNPNRPIPNRPAAGLIWRVGNGSDFFFIGAGQGPVRVRSSGRLYLGVNDDFLQDNSGSFRVIVYY